MIPPTSIWNIGLNRESTLVTALNHSVSDEALFLDYKRQESGRAYCNALSEKRKLDRCVFDSTAGRNMMVSL